MPEIAKRLLIGLHMRQELSLGEPTASNLGGLGFRENLGYRF